MKNNRIIQKTILLLYLVTLSILLVQCKNENEEPAPENLISDTMMVDILTDIFTTEAIMTQMSLQQKNRPETGKFFYHFIYDKYGIEKEDFIENIIYYSNDIEQIDSIYANVIVRLSELESE